MSFLVSSVLIISISVSETKKLERSREIQQMCLDRVILVRNLDKVQFRIVSVVLKFDKRQHSVNLVSELEM